MLRSNTDWRHNSDRGLQHSSFSVQPASFGLAEPTSVFQASVSDDQRTAREGVGQGGEGR